MLNNDFDPYQMLIDLQNTQQLINNNQQKMAQLVQSLAKKVTEQQIVIDMLIETVMTQNHTNEQILKDFLATFKSAQGQ